MRKTMLFIMIFILLIGHSGNLSYGNQSLSILMDGQLLKTDQAPRIIQGRTLAPLRAIFEALGAEVAWDGDTKTVSARKDQNEVILKIGNPYGTVNGLQKSLDVPGIIIEGRTFIPLRFISESLGARVDWDGTNKQVLIYSSKEINHEKEFRFREIAIGDLEEKVLKELGQPDRKDLSEYGFEWYIYHGDYREYLQVGIQNKRVVGLYTNADNWKSRKGVQIGTKKETVSQYFGKPITSIQKGNIIFQLNHGNEIDVYQLEDYYATIFYDIHQQNKVTAVQLIEKNTEEATKSLHGEPSGRLVESFERQVFDLANAIRVRNKLTPFSWDDKVAGTARKHSTDMASNQYFDHTNTRNQSPFDRMKDDGISFSRAAENIAAGQTSAIFAHEGWMNSAGHRTNILGNFGRLGVGVHLGGSFKTYYTQKFYTGK
ncbi:MAG: CAP-associated domain-containing protein [Thermotaleaceae bacterium]